MKDWSNLAKVVYQRTYARSDSGRLETWPETVARVIRGNAYRVGGPGTIEEGELDRLAYFMLERKATPAGRGLWFSGAPAHFKLGGAALNNCWFTTAGDWKNFVLAQDLLMLGGGVGMSVEHQFVSKLPRVRKDVSIVNRDTNDADFIIPDSREGWNEFTYRMLESFFVTGKSFSYSTVCLRGAGELIKGFGGKASGPLPLIEYARKLTELLQERAGRHIRPIDAGDIMCLLGEMVVSGNVRRSAIILLGDPWDKEYLKAKRWDLGILPTQRSRANFSVVCDDTEDLHPLFWKTYEVGEPFGIFNRKNAQKYGRMGELKKDPAIGLNPCGESTLEDGEPCNLVEHFLSNLKDEREFLECSRLMFRYAKRVCLEQYHHEKINDVVHKNQRVGLGISGCLNSPLFNEKTLDKVYKAIQKENEIYSQRLGQPQSIRTTLVKPGGTVPLVAGPVLPGIHAAWSRYMIRRIRFAANDDLIPILAECGHHIEPELLFDGTYNQGTKVVDFYVEHAADIPCADEDFTTWKQLDTLLFAQKWWADQAVSVTVYYRKEEIPEIKKWLEENISNLKSISFLCHNDHGFKQAPYEKITEEQYSKLASKIKPISEVTSAGELVDDLGCEGGQCPIK